MFDTRRVLLSLGCAAAMLAVNLAFAPPVSAQNPFNIDGSVCDSCSGVPTATKVLDPNGTTKELGPINSSSTKIGVINTAPTPMLGYTNPNSQVDLNTIYSQTAKANNGDLWYYFAWVRDSNNGSGFIAIEFEQAPVSNACSSTNYTSSSCNPWAGRRPGDFLLLWDSSGSSTAIIKRTFVLSNGVCCALGAGVSVTSAIAQYANGGVAGEAAIDLTTDVFPSNGTCTNFANIIPSTVTGNSDTADYKDTVLSAFPDVTNCGSVTISKKTDPAGMSGTFTYTLGAGGGTIFPSDLNNVVQSDPDCTNTTNTDTTCVATLTTDGDSDTIGGLLERDTSYQLSEDPGTGFSLTSIVCTLNGTTYPGTAFKVEAGQTTACVITNTVVKANPDKATVQGGTAQLYDEINLSNIKAGASDASSATVTFRLYSDNACTALVTGGTVGPLSLTYGTPSGGVVSATASTLTAGSPITILPGGTYYWRVTYSGDALNNGFTTACGSETGAVSFTLVD